MPGSYFLLRRAIEGGARPRAILLEVHPTYLAMPFREGLVDWPDLLDPRDCLDLAREARDASFFASTILARALPTVDARADIRRAILDALQGRRNLNRPVNRSRLRNFDKNDGALVQRRELPFEGDIAPYLQAMYLPPEWSCDALNERYLRRLLDLCASEKIQVYWMIPPFVPALQYLRERVGLDASYTRFTKRLQGDYPSVVVLDARRSGYPHPAFFDAVHLDYTGAVAFSTEVGRALAAKSQPAVGDRRWIDLPAFRVPSLDPPLEDMAQSNLAIATSGIVRR